MMGAPSSAQRIPFSGHCDRCDRTVAQHIPASQEAGGNGEARVCCAECGHPTLVTMEGATDV